MKQRTLTNNRCLSFWSDNLKSKIENPKWVGFLTTIVFLVACVVMAEAQQAKVYRVGVIHQSGP